LGLYISVPFCRQKCSYCNFASGVFSREKMERYTECLIAELADARALAEQLACELPREVDSIYLGGGTPTTLTAGQLERIFDAARAHFHVLPNAEITVECAPGTLSPEMLAELLRCGVGRVSFGVQSFVDQESRAVGRMHTCESTFADIALLRERGITSISVDLIAGLPHQTRQSWEQSLDHAIASGVPHVSVYMLEVDEDSRLGRELIAGGSRYHAHHVPDDELTAELYLRACERLNAAGITQYEISNFARPGHESRHNLKYWTRQPYLGIGLDAHSMLQKQNAISAPHPPQSNVEVALRFSTSDELESYLVSPQHKSTSVTLAEAFEEELFLGLRLNRGIALAEIESRLGSPLPPQTRVSIGELLTSGMLEENYPGRLSLSERGRLVSNEIFARLLGAQDFASVKP